MSNPVMDDYVTYITSLHKNYYVKQLADACRQYGEKEIAITELTGLNLDELIRVLSAGWTLEPPVYNTSLSEAVKGEENADIS